MREEQARSENGRMLMADVQGSLVESTSAT